MQDFDAYLADLRPALAQAEGWWAALATKHGRERMKLRWPAGMAAHPRVLAVYRAHHRRLVDPPTSAEPAPRFDDAAAWGSEAEGDPTQLLPPKPTHVLIDRLFEHAPELHARMVFLIVPPIGEPLEPRPRMATLEVLRPRPEGARAFDFGHRHDVERGRARLLGAGIDLRSLQGTQAMQAITLDAASEGHRLGFASYERALERALTRVERCWGAELAQRRARGQSDEQALAELYALHPAGPAGHPAVIGVLQAYWALCHEINAALVDPALHVAPELMLLAWLCDGRHQSWVEVLTALPYWPIGLSADGSWC